MLDLLGAATPRRGTVGAVNATPPVNSAAAPVPERVIAVFPNPGVDPDGIPALLEPLQGERRRDWFTDHFYYCLPLLIANQYGFVLRAQTPFSVFWNGHPSPEGLKVSYREPEGALQTYSSHFGNGILTIQNHWSIRTPPGVNVMTFAPPNFPKHGVHFMAGVVETDNLRRDFTFNLKITKPKTRVDFKAGEPIGAFIPIPRYYADSFELRQASDLFTPEQIRLETEAADELTRQRQNDDKSMPHEAGRRYFRGEDPWGTPFPDHQR